MEAKDIKLQKCYATVGGDGRCFEDRGNGKFLFLTWLRGLRVLEATQVLKEIPDPNPNPD